MIAIFDEDGGGDVDFQEFVSGLSAFSSKGNKEEKLHFAFKVYDIDRDGYISNGELFIVLKMMVGNNLKDVQLQQIVDKTIMEADKDRDGKISFEEFKQIVEKTDVSMTMTLGIFLPCPSSFVLVVVLTNIYRSNLSISGADCGYCWCRLIIHRLEFRLCFVFLVDFHTRTSHGSIVFSFISWRQGLHRYRVIVNSGTR